MSDDDNDGATKANLPEHARKRFERTCRWCFRAIYRAYSGAGDPSDPASCYWNLVWQEYADTKVCDARGDGAVLSTAPHEPCKAKSVTISRLIELAAELISEPGDFRDTHESYDAALAELITRAAGQPPEQSEYVERAIRRVAVETRGERFAKLAHRYGWVS
jgi:hypothetical protein